MNSGSKDHRHACLLAFVAAALSGCVHGVVVHSHRGEISGAVSPRLVLVAPVELRWREPSSLLAYLRSLDVEEALCRSGRLATMGPGELAALPGAGETPSENDVSRVALRTGVPVGQILFLRASAERREQSSSVRLDDAAGKAAGSARDAAVTLVARVELSLPAMHLVLVEASAEEELDPGAESPLFDAQPELSLLFRRAVDEALAALGDQVKLPPAIDLGLRTLPAPAPALLFALPRGQTFAQSIGGQDALEQEVSREGALDLLAHAGPPLRAQSGGDEPAPGLNAAERRSLKTDGRGLRVIQARGRARAAGLTPGDQILNIESMPATHPCAPLRAALLGSGAVHLEVERGGQVRPLSL